MAYSKPKVVAKSAKKSSYAAGCPTHSNGHGSCRSCEISG